jgi:hypothetical protein
MTKEQYLEYMKKSQNSIVKICNQPFETIPGMKGGIKENVGRGEFKYGTL